MQDILALSACELKSEMEKGRLSAEEATRAYLKRIREKRAGWGGLSFDSRGAGAA